MEINVFPAGQLDTVFRVLRTALDRHHPLSARELCFLDTYRRITGFRRPSALVTTIEARDVAIAGAHQRKRLLQLAAMAALLHHPIRASSVRYVRELSDSLGVDDPVVGVLNALEQRKFVRVRVLAMRRALRSMFKEAWLAEGAKGVLRFAGAMFLKTRVNADKQWRYRRLGLLPEGTLGREYWKHLTTEGFCFPGEPGGIPDSVAYHDVAHVLADNDSTPLGEIQQGAFQGGNRREDGFFFIQFVLLHFHHGVKITPAAPPQLGNYHPEKVLWAVHRGAQCRVDLTHQWNFWPLMEMKLAEARALLGLLPKSPAHELPEELRRAA